MVLLVARGAAYGALPVCSQTWFAWAAPEHPEAASVLFTASFQAAISLAGGAALDRSSLLGGVTAVLMLPVVRVHRSLAPSGRPGRT
ncbi:hypothetical protein GCM10017667_75380 [Streptomyces filamentosus]|uniref:Uncharacterized protein n=1 Tax=Streptomyces filamentosus TaxID=67294 RepID=A0A919BXS1_STRFL|nr:hypothetical protein GCM10017667_75380 [Streptomyces filamentosus]